MNTSSTREFTAHDGCTKSDAVLARVLTSLTGWKSVQRSRCSARSDRPPGWAYSPAKIQKQVNWSCCCTQQAVFQCRCNTSKCVVEGLKENPQQIPRLQLLGLQFFSVLLLKRHFHKLYIIVYWRFYSDFDFLKKSDSDFAQAVVSSWTLKGELHGMGFNGRAASFKPYVTKNNAKSQMQWCKAHRHWILEQWRRVLGSDKWSDGWVLAVGRRTILFWLHFAKC